MQPRPLVDVIVNDHVEGIAYRRAPAVFTVDVMTVGNIPFRVTRDDMLAVIRIVEYAPWGVLPRHKPALLKAIGSSARI